MKLNPRTYALQDKVCDETSRLQMEGTPEEKAYANSETRLQMLLQEAYEHASQLEGELMAKPAMDKDSLHRMIRHVLATREGSYQLLIKKAGFLEGCLYVLGVLSGPKLPMQSREVPHPKWIQWAFGKSYTEKETYVDCMFRVAAAYLSSVPVKP